jgi:hypothetical protein
MLASRTMIHENLKSSEYSATFSFKMEQDITKNKYNFRWQNRSILLFIYVGPCIANHSSSSHISTYRTVHIRQWLATLLQNVTALHVIGLFMVSESYKKR